MTKIPVTPEEETPDFESERMRAVMAFVWVALFLFSTVVGLAVGVYLKEVYIPSLP